MPIGYNRAPNDDMKHYRRFFNDELENNKAIMPDCPFINEGIYRMVEKKAGLFGMGGSNDASGNAFVYGGFFKGAVQVFNVARKEKRSAVMEKLLHEIKELIKGVYEA